MYPINREEYVHAYLAAMKEEIEQAHFAREHGSEDDAAPGDRFYEIIAEKLRHWHRSDSTHSRWISSH